ETRREVMTMARKKEGPPPEGTAAAHAQEADQTTHSQPDGGNGDRRRPAASWRLQSDRTTSVEVSAWLNTHTSAGGEEYEQVSFTIQRSYRTDQGWQRGGSWRTHDVPVLLFLLEKAHAFALERRVTADVPF